MANKEVVIPGVVGGAKVDGGWKVGAWLFDNGWYYAECSRCGEMAYHAPSKYCPECGAMMTNYEPAVKYYKDLLETFCEKKKEQEEK